MTQAVSRFAIGLLASLALHAVFFGGGVAFFGGSFRSDDSAAVEELPQLDVTSVDLSFAETENEQAAPSVAQPAVENPEPQPPPPPPTHAFSDPPPLVVESALDAVPVRVAEDALSSKLRPPDLEVPDTPLKTVEERETSETSEPPPETPEPRKPEAVSAPPQQASAASAPTQARIDAPPSPRKNIKPKYPEGARKRGEQGDVTLELEVDAQGTVSRVSVVASCGFAELEQAAIAAARRARFRPAKRGETPVSATARLTLTFRLRD